MNSDKERKVINLNIRITESVKKGLDKLAEEDRRTVSDFIRLQLESLVQKGQKRQ